MKILLLVFLTLITTLKTYAKVYYVSTSGSNSNSGLSTSLAWRTLTYAAGNNSPVTAGDIVYIQAGDYGAEYVVFGKSGASNKPISYIGYKNQPGDAPSLLVDNNSPYAAYKTSDMPTFNGGDRTKGIGFNCEERDYLVLKNFQIQNYKYGLVAGSGNESGHLELYNINVMSIGDVNNSYSGEGIMFGSMSTRFSNYNSITNCMVVNACAEGFSINGDHNILSGCKVYCNDNTGSAPTDYYIIISGSYNRLSECYVERTPGLSHIGHGISLKSNAVQIIDLGNSYTPINPEHNVIEYCTAKNMGESFCVRHRGVQYNLFYHCTAIGTRTGSDDPKAGEGMCIVTRDGASNNTFDGCIAKNCLVGIDFKDTVEDGDWTAAIGHPGNNNIYINCIIYNCYYGVYYDPYSIQSDAGSNTIANCTFYRNKYLFSADRHCKEMKYVNNIIVGCSPSKLGGGFCGGNYPEDIVPNNGSTYTKHTDFCNIENKIPTGFISGSLNNFSADPLFVGPDTYNFHLKQGSPCIGTGTPLSFVTTDFDGNPRSATNSCLGAFEYPTSIPLTATISSMNVKCNEDNDGSATVTVAGGKTPYTYLWSNGKSSSAISSLVAGSYSVTVTDANATSNTISVLITQPIAITLAISKTNVNCNGGNDGSATVTASGGTSPYTYTWNIGQTKMKATGLKAGNYTVAVTDANGCTKTSDIVSITQPTVIKLVTTSTNLKCNGESNATASVTASGGTGLYTYSWSNGQTSPTAANLNAGDYSVKVTDANGCTKTSDIISITQPTPIRLVTTSTNVNCNDGNDGSATVTASGGTGAYTYSWSNGQTNPTAANLKAGDYTVKVTDANGCTKTSDIISITQPDPITLATSATDVNCNDGNDGSATVTASGGTGLYTYSWSNGQTSPTAANLKAGNYQVSITDANGCSIQSTVTVAEPAKIILTNAGQNNVSIHGGSDGKATVSVSGGQAPFTYLWSNGQTIATATGLIAGTYTVTATDAHRCSEIMTFTILEPAADIVLASSSQINVRCNGESNGSAMITVSGGQAPYSYLWSNGQAGNSISGLSAGSYYVTVKDVNYLSKTFVVVISEPDPIILSIRKVDVKCNGINDGHAEALVTGGGGSYRYRWVPSEQTSADAQKLAAINYTVYVVDRQQCNASKLVTISQPAKLVIDKIAVTNPTTCSSNDGSIRVSVSGGVGNYSHNWNTSPPQITATAIGLFPREYADSITDKNGCTVMANATVTCTNPTDVPNKPHQTNDLTVYPNPTTGPFNITTPVQQNGKPILVVVRDLLGREYYSKIIVVSNNKEIFTIDPSGKLAPGVYLVIATSDDKQLYEKKIVVQ